MGGKLSFDGPRPDLTVCISINSTDLLRVIHPVRGLVDAVRKAVVQGWPTGIQRESIYGDIHEFKMNGRPWYADGKQAVQSRELVRAVLQAAANSGLQLLLASDVSRAPSDASSFFFTVGKPVGLEQMIAVSTHETDKLRLIGAPPEHAQNLQREIVAAIESAWPQNVQRFQDYHGVPEWKLKGNPWWADGEDAVHSRVLVLQILQRFESLGYVFYVSADVSKKVRDSDTIYFRYAPDVAQQGSKWTCISMARSDRLRCICAPSSVPEAIRGVISTGWPRGIQATSQYAGSQEFKLNGYPWWADGADSVHSRSLVTAMLQAMAGLGWHVAATADIMRKNSDKSSWFFRQGPPQFLPGMLCLSLNESDKIRVIGGDAASKEAATKALSRAVSSAWPKEIQRTDAAKSGTAAYEIKVKGNPWWSHGSEALYSRSLLCHVASNLLAAGLRPIVSADVSAKYVSQDKGPDYPIDVHSWWVVPVGKQVE